jgi:phenylacetate-CoA ligase
MAQPCIRFDSKDIIEWAPEACPCQRSFRLVKGGVLGRVDDIIKVKGVLLSPTAVEEIVRTFPELADEYEVLVTREGDLDQVELKVELLPGSENRWEEIRERLTNLLRHKTHLGYRIECYPYGELPRYDVKARRFKDLRHG